MGALRAFDAAANRAREGLRVVEDFVRFVLDDGHLTNQLKQLRHELTTVVSLVPADALYAARETQADVGAGLSSPGETSRTDASSVLAANFKLLQESLRSLEEFAKVLAPGADGLLKQLRYRSYTLERAVQITATSLARLSTARLYVLIDGGATLEQFTTMAESLIRAGVHILQLRDKRLDDRSLIERGRRLHELTRGTQTLFIMNDRPDLATLTQADGVHVGQEELSVKDARTIVGPAALVGVSTHSLDQARRAVLDGANYIGVGPTFPSETKHFDRFTGAELLQEVAREIRLPAFAIGGIHRENLPLVLSSGITRVAVSGAITAADSPAEAARELLASLQKSEVRSG
ncbi:MAG: thiamine phosphate synthase [Planctomycetes bacterium]|nr:thiamine phosphate synthase [Planctomycetota bacterium]